MTRLVSLLLVTILSSAALAQAPANPPVRVRGTVQMLDGNMLTVKTRAGDTVAIKMAENFAVMGLVKASANDIGSNKYIGTTTVGERDGALVAEEIHIFTEAMRGTAEGHYDWDLRPNSKMTNANVASISSMGKDRVMTVQYKGGEKKILVPPSAIVVAFTPSDKGELKPGAHIFCVAQRQPDGSLAAARVNVGLKGQIPPM